MPDRIAIKRLTASDLTFFEWQFRNRNAGNQKSINLNADVFVDELYPAVPDLTVSLDEGISVGLTLFGPGAKGSHRLTRKIIKGGAYKNWRLNGEFVRNPDDDETRFNVLEPDDLALMVFIGEPLPRAIEVYFIAAGVPADAQLHAALLPLVEGKRVSMARLTKQDVTELVGGLSLEAGHPIERVLSDPELEAALEDASLGGEQGTLVLRRRRGRKVTAAELARARASAERVGRDGEGLVNLYLVGCKVAGELAEVEWTADVDAVAPYDFKIVTAQGEIIKIDVKSTNGAFLRPLHLSASEVDEAAVGPERYDIYRVYDISIEGAKLQRASNIGTFAREIRAGFSLPKGVRPDGFSIDPSVLDWHDEIAISRPDEE